MQGNMPLEIERKYLIEFPKIEDFSTFPSFQTAQIEQIYLNSSDGTTKRIRKKQVAEDVIYTKTEKLRISDATCIEKEESITEDAFFQLKKERDEGLNTVFKTRHSFLYEGHTIEIDVYPFWDNVAVMEIELSQENEYISFPSFIHIIREITNEKAFKNRQIAEKIPDLKL